MWEYTEKVKDHFLNPRNVGEVENPDGIGEVGSLACGDALRLSFKLDENKRIKEVKFKTFGCASAIASSSALTEMIKGMTLEEALKVTNRDIAEYLGGLPDEKMHCSVMGKQALEKAIESYLGSVKQEPANIICECFGVTEREIERAVRENDLSTIEDVTHYTKAGGGCGKCQALIEKILARAKSEGKAKDRPQLTNLQKIKLIEDTIEREIRPILKQDGGDLKLVDIVGNRVIVALMGTCARCKVSSVTLKNFVENKLREVVSPKITVEEEYENDISGQ